jgi:hypothetical protein
LLRSSWRCRCALHAPLSVVEPGLGYSTVADTGDRFFLTLPFPSVACFYTPSKPSLRSGKFAKSLLLPTSFGFPLALAFRSFCCSCLRVSRYVVSLFIGSLSTTACAFARPRTLPSRALSCRSLYPSRPSTAFDRAGLPGFFTTLCVIDDLGKRIFKPYKQSLQNSACHFLGWTSTLLKRRDKASPTPT